MSSFIQATEYPNEGFAIVTDTAGRYVVTKASPDIIPLPDKEDLDRHRSVLLQPQAIQRRELMLA